MARQSLYFLLLIASVQSGEQASFAKDWCFKKNEWCPEGRTQENSRVAKVSRRFGFNTQLWDATALSKTGRKIGEGALQKSAQGPFSQEGQFRSSVSFP